MYFGRNTCQGGEKIKFALRIMDMKRLFMRGIHFIQRIINESKRFNRNRRNFGWKVAETNFFDGLVPPGKSKKYIDTIEAYVSEYLKPLVLVYQKEQYIVENEMHTAFDKVPVWCCWWQGVDHMPEIVKMCNDRLRRVLPENAELHMITEENYAQYVNFPDHIMTKFKEGKMSITAFSDILRVNLLAQYGGFWIDATVFISDTFPQEFLTRGFYSQRMFDPVKWSREACKGRWCGFMMSGTQGNIIFRFLRDAFYMWWKDYDDVIDYVILDYFLLAAYHSVPAVKKQIDNVPDNNVDVFEMYKTLHLPYSVDLFDKLTNNTVMHKLTYKIQLVKQTETWEDTLYQHLLDSVNGGKALRG